MDKKEAEIHADAFRSLPIILSVVALLLGGVLVSSHMWVSLVVMIVMTFKIIKNIYDESPNQGEYCDPEADLLEKPELAKNTWLKFRINLLYFCITFIPTLIAERAYYTFLIRE